MEVPVSGRRFARWRWQAGGLTALFVLLFAVAHGPAVATSVGESSLAASAGTFGGPSMTTHLVPAANRADLRLLVKRNGSWAPALVIVAGCALAHLLVPPSGWRVGRDRASDGGWATAGRAYRGRGPPAA